MPEKLQLAVIDDSALDRKLIEMLVRVKRLPIHLQVFHHPLDALQQLTDGTSGFIPQALIVDINMPLLNGFDFVDRFAELLSPTRPFPRIFLASSSIRPADQARAEAHPLIVRFIEKPFTREILESIY